MLLKPLDFVVLGAYFAILVGIGVYFSRRQTSTDEYFLGGRTIGWFLAGASILASLLSSVAYLAVPGEMIRHGIGLFTEKLAFIVIIPIVAFYIIPALRKLPDTNVYDFLGRRFNPQTGTLASVIFVLMRIVWMGLIVYTCCQAVTAMTGWSLPVLASIVAGVTVLYTTLGGMRAVVWTDLMQLGVLAGGALGVPVYVAIRTGDGPLVWWATFSQAERASVPVFSIDPRERVTVVGAVLSLLVWHLCTHSSDQIAAQRYLSTPSVPSAQRSFVLFSAGNLGLIGALLLCAVAIFHFEYRNQDLPISQFQEVIGQEGDQVFPRFIATEVPVGLSGLLLAAILAAGMSSLSSGMNSVAAVLTSLAINRLPDGAPRDDRRLLGPFLLTIVVGVVAIAVAIVVDYFMRTYSWNLVTLMNRINHLFVAPLGAMFLGALWFPSIGVTANYIGLVAGILVSILTSFSGAIFGYEISFTWIMPAAFVVDLGVALAISVFFPSTQHATREASPLPQ